MRRDLYLSRVTGCALAICCSIGCDQPPEAPTPPPAASAPTAEKGIAGVKLYEKVVAEEHTIAFYDFGQGTQGIRETFPVDRGDKSVMSGLENVTSLAPVYLKLNPTETAAPQALLDSDRAAEVARASKIPADWAAPLATAKPARAPQGSFLADSSCSDDSRGDGWGGDWFLSNYCNAGNRRWCKTNLGEALSGKFSGWARWSQMEGDYNVAGHGTVQVTRCNLIWCEPRTILYDQDVFPRRIVTWTFTDTRDRFDADSTSPCGHLHVAFGRN
jgi:hypothetical protein